MWFMHYISAIMKMMHIHMQIVFNVISLKKYGVKNYDGNKQAYHRLSNLSS